MSHLTSVAPTVLSSFMASMVEFVEALTIVLAVGIVRGWRSALLGTAAALGVLLAVGALLGPSLAHLPLPVVQLAVGTLLLMFGLRWLRKAVLRAAGVLALHDEAKAFAEETESLRRAGDAAFSAIDTIAFWTCFKIVLLEGIEVVFIVIAIGAGGPLLVPASIGAGLALVVVAVLGLLVHRPLAMIPENTLKFGVGVLLSAFGSYWVGEGIGLAWPGADWAILGLIAANLMIALALVPVCRRLHRLGNVRAQGPAKPSVAPSFGALGAVLQTLWSLFVDDIWLAAGIVALVGAFWLTRANAAGAATVSCVAFAVGLNAVFVLSAARRAKV